MPQPQCKRCKPSLPATHSFEIIKKIRRDAPSPEVFKARLDGALNNLGWWKMSLLMAGGLEPDAL